MCGIIAISSAKGAAYALGPALAKLRHRGPDDQGTYAAADGAAHLGQARLSILDLSPAGHQPMRDASGRYVIAYNGEVYNYLELRAGLERRHGPIAWRSGTDTEVIVEGFAREGAPFLERLNGIFAFAIHDSLEGSLHVLRDPLGIKPLFVTEQGGGVFFGSELKGLLGIPGLRRNLRVQSLSEQLMFMYVPEPHTMFREFHKVEPGVLLVCREGRIVGRSPMFRGLWQAPPLAGEAEAVEALRHALSEAVKRQLAADVPVSLFLSGGLDSSAVARLAMDCGANVKDAYTISFSDEDMKRDAQSDDLHYASLMAGKLGLKLRVIPARKDFLSLLTELSPYMEDGFSDPAAINTYLICAGARAEGVKVMLSGQGADEYLGGYRRYAAERMLRRIPAAARGAIAAIGGMLPETLPGRFNALNRRAKRLGRLAEQPAGDRILGMYSWAGREEVCGLFADPGSMDPGKEFLDLLQSYADLDVVDAMMRLDHRYDLLSLNLCYTDRLSMAAGVEARVPFLDFDLVRVMNSIPVDLKLKGATGKYVLRKAMEPLLPREVIYREKAGFGLPLRSWLGSRNGLVDRYLEPARIARQGIFDPAAVDRLLGDHFRGIRDYSYVLLTMLTQQIWLDANA